ncbi:MAG: hypothetical protein ACJ768_17785 [Gaiellaceae bacterium]
MKANRRQAVFLFGAALVSGLLCSVALAGNPHGTPPGQATTTTTDNSAGVKPSNDTHKAQTCTTGGGQGSSATCQSSTYPGKADSSKKYGNGKTAAQIANGKGAPSGTPVYGPGNSQPHKICGRDVHAYKGSSKKCPSSTQSNTQSGSTNGSLNTAGTNGTGSTADTGTSASSGNPSSSTGVLGASHTTSGKPVAARAKPAHAVLGTASFTG